MAAGDDGAKAWARGAQAGQQAQQVGADGGVGQHVFGVVQHEQPLPAGQRTEQCPIVVERLFGHEQAQRLAQVRQAGLAAEVDEGYRFAGSTAAGRHRQRQLGFARTGQPFKHHHGVTIQVFGQTFKALLVVHIVARAGRQLWQPPEPMAAQSHWQ